jgi:hypothetical protein
MREIRALGDESLREAELGLATVKTNREQAQAVLNYMQAYKLLADYYERKALAATAALIYSFGGSEVDRQEAEQRADEAVESYSTAMQFISREIDHNSGAIKGRWLGGKTYTLPELIDREQEERRQLPQLFDWPNASPESNKKPRSTAPRAGTFAPETNQKKDSRD